MDIDAVVYADRSDRGKLRFSGPQRAWFLHQVLTQAFEDADPGTARDAAMITPHGRMQGYLEALTTDDAILSHFEPELLATLPEAIGRYVFATQVQIEDVTEEMGLVLVAGPRWEDVVSVASTAPLVHPTQALGIPAAYVWVERRDVDRTLEALSSRGARATDEDVLEAIRIANGVPRWGRDMDERTIPQEAGIDERAVHYDKGCYLGQEAMAKIHFRGKVNRSLRRLRADGALDAGADVFLDGTKVGRVTSASDGLALAMLRKTVEPGAAVVVGDAEARVVA